MADLFWPGDDRAGDHFTQDAFLRAMLAVERAWLGVLVEAGVAPADAVAPLDVEPRHVAWLSNEAELGGNPVVALVGLLRDDPETGSAAGRWLHRGLTSQDVVDTALVLLAQHAVTGLRLDLRDQVEVLTELAVAHRDTPMVARTLTQHAVPTTFGLKVAGWLTPLLDAYDELATLRFPVQVGGAAGTLAGLVELAPAVAGELPGRLAADLGLEPSLPWHTHRAPLTRLGDALVRCTDAWGRLANDVLALGRPEVGELSEGSGGGSSTMPHKANPVLSVLVRRAALTTPQLAATLHLCAADTVDERAVGGWHAEWATLRDLVRRTMVAASQTSDLLGGLEVHTDRMATTLAASRDDVHSEQRTLADVAGHAPRGDYLGQAGTIVDTVVRRAQEAVS